MMGGMGGGGGFLRSAAATAAGVAGGALLFEGISSLFGNHYAGGLMSGGMTPGLGESVVNNYYGSDAAGGAGGGDWSSDAGVAGGGGDYSSDDPGSQDFSSDQDWGGGGGDWSSRSFRARPCGASRNDNFLETTGFFGFCFYGRRARPSSPVIMS
jgi:hypothetical protein